MNKIELMEVNQHTSDEVAKVLADLKAQGVDIAAIRNAVGEGGSPKGMKEFTENGTFVVPAGVTVIYVTACGGGGGGSAGGNPTGTYQGTNACGSGGGGGGADCIMKQPFAVTEGQTIAITIGKGGAGGIAYQSKTAPYVSAGTGGTTVVGDLVTLSGGGAGKDPSGSGGAGGTGGVNAGGGGGGGKYRDSDYADGKGGAGDYENGNGAAAYVGGVGGRSLFVLSKGAAGGLYPSSGDWGSGGGGGSCLAKGGKGGDGYSSSAGGATPGLDGSLGSGGGGGGAGGSTYNKNGGKGGDGFVRIEW